MAEVSLLVEGQLHPGWQRVEIVRSMDDFVDTAALQLTSPLSSVTGPVEIDEWSEAEVLIDGRTVIAGYVLAVTDAYTRDSYTVNVTAASRAIDLVHCGAGAAKKRWANVTIADIVADLVAPYDLDVVTTEVTDRVPRFAVKIGETVFEAIDRLVREHGMRALSLDDGTVALTRTGASTLPTALVSGKNIVSGSRQRSSEDRFNTYIFKSQTAGTKDSYGEAATEPKAEVVDEGVPRFRPMVVRKDAARGSAGLRARAEWERNTRAGASRTLTYQVLSGPDLSECWYAAPGQLWAPNYLVGLRDDFFGIDAELLITEAKLSRDDGGTKAFVTLAHPEAYLPERPPKKKGKKGFVW